MGTRVRSHGLRRACSHQATTAVAAFRTEVDDPVSRSDHVQVVLDDGNGMPCVDQFAKGAQETRNVVKV